MRKVTVITMQVTQPLNWTVDDVIDEIATLMELSDEDPKPDFITGEGRSEWRTHE